MSRRNKHNRELGLMSLAQAVDEVRYNISSTSSPSSVNRLHPLHGTGAVGQHHRHHHGPHQQQQALLPQRPSSAQQQQQQQQQQPSLADAPTMTSISLSSSTGSVHRLVLSESNASAAAGQPSGASTPPLQHPRPERPSSARTIAQSESTSSTTSMNSGAGAHNGRPAMPKRPASARVPRLAGISQLTATSAASGGTPRHDLSARGRLAAAASAAAAALRAATPNNDSKVNIPRGAMGYFERAFPTWRIASGDSCPECSRRMTDGEIRAGWVSDANSYTTQCPDCNERFVARFEVHPVLERSWSGLSSISGRSASVLSKTADNKKARDTASASDHPGSANGDATPPTSQEATAAATTHGANNNGSGQGDGVGDDSNDQGESGDGLGGRKPVSCVYLPPLVLQKEVERVLTQNGAAFMASAEFQDVSATIFWNLAWSLSQQNLPVDFLLLGRMMADELAAAAEMDDDDEIIEESVLSTSANSRSVLDDQSEYESVSIALDTS